MQSRLLSKAVFWNSSLERLVANYCKKMVKFTLKTELELCSAVERKKCLKSTSTRYALQYALEEFMVMHNKKK